MKLDLTDSNVGEFWRVMRKTKLADEFRNQLPESCIKEQFEGELGITSYVPGKTFVTVNNVDIPIDILRDINASVEAWETVSKTVQALEMKGYEAHRFFKFPEFITSSGVIKLEKYSFILDKPIGSRIPLFKASEVSRIFGLTKNG